MTSAPKGQALIRSSDSKGRPLCFVCRRRVPEKRSGHWPKTTTSPGYAIVTGGEPVHVCSRQCAAAMRSARYWVDPMRSALMTVYVAKSYARHPERSSPTQVKWAVNVLEYVASGRAPYGASDSGGPKNPAEGTAAWDVLVEACGSPEAAARRVAETRRAVRELRRSGALNEVFAAQADEARAVLAELDAARRTSPRPAASDTGAPTP
jgi:hypothetical protein